MTRAVTLGLNDFACAALVEQADMHRGSLDELVRTALMYYLSDLGSQRVAVRIPRRPGGQSARGSIGFAGSPLPVQVSLEESAWTTLEREAGRQSVSLARLIQHAALYYLADLDSGRVAERVLERAGSEIA